MLVSAPGTASANEVDESTNLDARSYSEYDSSVVESDLRQASGNCGVRVDLPHPSRTTNNQIHTRVESFCQGNTIAEGIAVKSAGRITREIDGMREAERGQLWRPKYFDDSRGIAIHGSASVPNYPASAGCVRVTNAAMDFIWQAGLAPVGTTVWVYPENYYG
jgi:hypothetical protein